jgi:hypothetical protein
MQSFKHYLTSLEFPHIEICAKYHVIETPLSIGFYETWRNKIWIIIEVVFEAVFENMHTQSWCTQNELIAHEYLGASRYKQAYLLHSWTDLIKRNFQR